MHFAMLNFESYFLESSLTSFMGFWRTTWPDETIPPKYHFLEKHVAEFIRTLKAGLGFYGEQGKHIMKIELVNIIS